MQWAKRRPVSRRAKQRARSPRQFLTRFVLAGSILVCCGSTILWWMSWREFDTFFFHTVRGLRYDFFGLQSYCGGIELDWRTSDPLGYYNGPDGGLSHHRWRQQEFDRGTSVQKQWLTSHRTLTALGFILIYQAYPKTAWHPANTSRIVVVPYWAIVVASTLLPTMGLVLWRRRNCVGLCSRCGYDLRASTGRCPECGTPQPPPTEQSPTPAPAA